MDEKMKELSQVLPSEIEARSFEIITEELGERTFPEKEAPIVKRVIHTTADFEYADSLVFSSIYLHSLFQNPVNCFHIQVLPHRVCQPVVLLFPVFLIIKR